MTEQMIDIYNERMEKIGQKDRSQVHKDGDWHKAFHCWIIYKDASGEEYVLMQRRSPTKESVPNSLDITAAGHLNAGEEPKQGLRELEEEMGVKIEPSRLIDLGIHVEVYCDSKRTNREFDHVYLLEYEKNISEYRVEPKEVVALTRIRVADGIALFAKDTPKIQALTIKFGENGAPEGQPLSHDISIDEFAGGERNNYFIKVFILAKRYFQGERLLFI